jgi:hypothetical protein
VYLAAITTIGFAKYRTVTNRFEICWYVPGEYLLAEERVLDEDHFSAGSVVDYYIAMYVSTASSHQMVLLM